MAQPRKTGSTSEDNDILSVRESRTPTNKTNRDSPQCISVTFQNLICKLGVYNSEYILQNIYTCIKKITIVGSWVNPWKEEGENNTETNRAVPSKDNKYMIEDFYFPRKLNREWDLQHC